MGMIHLTRRIALLERVWGHGTIWLTLAFLATSATVDAASGVVYYDRIPSLNSPAALRRVNADGSGDQAIPLQVPQGLYPSVSADGQRLLVTSTDPGRPFKISNNVFIQDLRTGAAGRITSYEDVLTSGTKQFTNDLGQVTNNLISAGYTINFPYHKAFSPDGAYVVVMTLRKTGSTSRDNFASNTNGPGQLFATSGRFPVVEVFRVADGAAVGSYIYLGVERTGANQGGDGVDWHPTRNEIVATLSSDIPATGTAGLTSTEGTLLALFNASGLSPFLRKLTAPRAQIDFFFAGGSVVSVSATEHDYAPAVSPNGQQVAFVRHTQRRDSRYDGAGIAPLPAQCAIRIINYDGTNDREVLRLSDGLWVTKIDWSPDGRQIVFDLAPQMVISGWWSFLGDVARSELYVVNADGTNPSRLAAAPAAFPTWAVSPTGTGEPPLPPRLQTTRNGNRLQIRIEPLTPGRGVNLERTSDLRNWTSVFSFQPAGSSETLTIDPTVDQPRGFYRVVLP